LKDFVIRNAEEYLHTYANRRAHIVAHNKAYGHIEAVRGKPKVDEDGKVIYNFSTVNNGITFFDNTFCPSLHILFNISI
jgi:hypothetical protein